MAGIDGGIPGKGELSRRDFLRLSGVVTLSWVLGGCAPEPTQIPSVTETSTPPPGTLVSPTETPIIKPTSPPPTPSVELIPPPTPTVEGPTIPGETLNIGGADLELKTTSGKEIATQIGAEEKGWKIVTDENGKSSFFVGYTGEKGKEIQMVSLVNFILALVQPYSPVDQVLPLMLLINITMDPMLRPVLVMNLG